MNMHNYCPQLKLRRLFKLQNLSSVIMRNTKHKETIIVCSAHSDDFVLGAGGTITNYVQDGKKVLVAVFSYGEKGLPWLQEKFAQKIRADETFEAGGLLKCKVNFFSLKEGKFLEEYQEQKVDQTLLKLIEKEKPSKIFTHSNEDPHPDHRAVHKITLEVCDKSKHKPEIYIYSIWNPVSFRTNYPSLYVDVSKSFSKKINALKTFRSQKIHVAYPVIILFWRALKDGFHIRKMFGEHFFRIR